MKTDHPMRWPQPTIYSTEQSERPAPIPRLAIFVYGTLMAGQKNHDYFCGNAAQIRPATTCGRLYALPAGYPALVAPEKHILAHGTADPLADTATQTRFTATPDLAGSMARPAGDWDLVHGQLIEFADPLRALPPLDRLEGFRPCGISLYQRVLLPVQTDCVTRFAWTYTMAECAGGHRLWEGIWR